LLTESFTGVLFVGLCGAILFGKAIRLESIAQVTFSQPLVVRFGSGLRSYDASGDDSEENETTDGISKKKGVPCPILEFRVVNNLSDEESGGEIIDASITCISLAFDTSDLSSSLHESKHSNNHNRWNGGISLKSRLLGTDDTLTNLSTSSHDPASSHNGIAEVHRKRTLALFKKPLPIDEGHPSFRFLYTNLKLVNPEHPYFRRVWTVRHVLNEMSPLLTNRVKKLIKKNGGLWPIHMSNYESIRNNLKFDQLIVSMKGVSNLSGYTVYMQKVYDYVDVVVGYEFVHVLSQRPDGTVVTEMEYLDDVVEQKGDDCGEPLVQ